ncbi:hypothetical protein [Prevotella sp. 10(H)]|uniref:hypothetical protein n=1 Tax=Prevotella sp. 10(H) TaxID=1158294 RepID=UPI0004A6C417|nr:hypothetical protein [Prevotella sp. 10(H)]
MKKYTYFAVLFSLVVLFSFSSCSKDDHYYWDRGRLDYTAELTVTTNKVFQTSFRVYEDNIRLRGNNRYVEIHDIKFISGYSDIYVYTDGYIDWMDLRVEGTNAKLQYDVIHFDFPVQDETDQAQYFLDMMIEQIRRYGYATIIVDGKGDIDSDYDIEFGVDLDLYVRE